MSQYNIKTGQTAAVTTGYTQVVGTFLEAFAMRSVAEDVYLSVGHASPVDATSVLIDANTGWGVDDGVVGPIYVKAVTVNSTVHWSGA